MQSVQTVHQRFGTSPLDDATSQTLLAGRFMALSLSPLGLPTVHV